MSPGIERQMGLPKLRLFVLHSLPTTTVQSARSVSICIHSLLGRQSLSIFNAVTCFSISL